MLPVPQDVEWVIHKIEEAGFEAFIVGGPVRDLLRGAVPHDWDIATSARPKQVMALFPKTVPTGLKHGTVTVVTETAMVEVTTYRREGAYRNHRAPEKVDFVQELAEDLKRRDFTINAMAFRPGTDVVDLFGGQDDLKKGVVRAVGEARERFEEDALRMLRAVRFACQLDFDIEEQTLAAVAEKAPLLQYISGERIAAELTAALCSQTPRHMMLLAQSGLAAYCLPEMSDWTLAEWEQAASRLERVPAEKPLRFAAFFGREDQDAALCADLAEQAMKRLKMDRRTIACVHTILMNRNQTFPLQAAALKRLVRTVGEPLLRDVLLFSASGCGQKQKAAEAAANTLQCYQLVKERNEPVFMCDLAISGHDLKALGLQGKEIGEMLHKLLEWVTEHPAQNQKALLLERIKCMRKGGRE